jgi:hypothetical protein
MTKEQELIEKQRELIKVYEDYVVGNEIEGFVWDNWAKGANLLIKEISALESEIAKEKDEPLYAHNIGSTTAFVIAKEKDEPKMSAEEFMNSKGWSKDNAYIGGALFSAISELLTEYANQFKQ